MPCRGVEAESLHEGHGARLANVLVVDPPEQVVESALTKRARRRGHLLDAELLEDGAQDRHAPREDVPAVRPEPLELEAVRLAELDESGSNALEPATRDRPVAQPEPFEDRRDAPDRPAGTDGVVPFARTVEVRDRLDLHPRREHRGRHRLLGDAAAGEEAPGPGDAAHAEAVTALGDEARPEHALRAAAADVDDEPASLVVTEGMGHAEVDEARLLAARQHLDLRAQALGRAAQERLAVADAPEGRRTHRPDAVTGHGGEALAEHLESLERALLCGSIERSSAESLGEADPHAHLVDDVRPAVDLARDDEVEGVGPEVHGRERGLVQRPAPHGQDRSDRRRSTRSMAAPVSSALVAASTPSAIVRRRPGGLEHERGAEEGRVARCPRLPREHGARHRAGRLAQRGVVGGAEPVLGRAEQGQFGIGVAVEAEVGGLDRHGHQMVPVDLDPAGATRDGGHHAAFGSLERHAAPMPEPLEDLDRRPEHGPVLGADEHRRAGGRDELLEGREGVRTIMSPRTFRRFRSGGQRPVAETAAKPALVTQSSASEGSQVIESPRASSTFAAVSPRRGGTQRSDTTRTRAPAAAATSPAATSRGGIVSCPSWGGETDTSPFIPDAGDPGLSPRRHRHPHELLGRDALPAERDEERGDGARALGSLQDGRERARRFLPGEVARLVRSTRGIA